VLLAIMLPLFEMGTGIRRHDKVERIRLKS